MEGRPQHHENHESLKKKRLLEGLSDLHLVTNEDRVTLLEILEGQKDACDIELVVPENSKEDVELLHETASKIWDLLQELGLPFYMETDTYDMDGNGNMGEMAYFLVGKNQETVDKLFEITEHPEKESFDQERGRLFGIPQTAIDAWDAHYTDSNAIIDPSELPQQYQTEVLNFLSFALSREHWKEELKIVQKRAEKIKQVAPELYQQVVTGS